MGGFGFTGFGIRFLNLLALETEQVQTLNFSGRVGNEFSEQRFGLLNGFVQLMNLGCEGACSGKGIDEVQLAGGVHESLLVMLAMNVQERWSKFLQCRNGRRLAVNEDAVASVARNLAADNDLRAFGIKASPLKFGGDIGFKYGFDDRSSLSRTNRIRRGFRAGDQAQRVDDDGFAGAGFSRQQIKGILKVDFQLIDESKVSNSKKAQHTSPVIRH